MNSDGSVRFIALVGTGCLIGSRGWALTASHVVKGQSEMRALFVDTDQSWTAVPIGEVERHPTEDLAVVRLVGHKWGSVSRRMVLPSAPR